MRVSQVLALPDDTTFATVQKREQSTLLQVHDVLEPSCIRAAYQLPMTLVDVAVRSTERRSDGDSFMGISSSGEVIAFGAVHEISRIVRANTLTPDVVKSSLLADLFGSLATKVSTDRYSQTQIKPEDIPARANFEVLFDTPTHLINNTDILFDKLSAFLMPVAEISIKPEFLQPQQDTQDRMDVDESTTSIQSAPTRISHSADFKQAASPIGVDDLQKFFLEHCVLSGTS